MLNEEILSTVINEAKTKVRDARNWACLRAIDRAGVALRTRRWSYDEATGVLTIAGQNGGSYRANGTCQCIAFSKGHTLCKHRVAARILQRYHEALAAQPLSCDRCSARITDATDITETLKIDVTLCGKCRRDDERESRRQVRENAPLIKREPTGVKLGGYQI